MPVCRTMEWGDRARQGWILLERAVWNMRRGRRHGRCEYGVSRGLLLGVESLLLKLKCGGFWQGVPVVLFMIRKTGKYVAFGPMRHLPGIRRICRTFCQGEQPLGWRSTYAPDVIPLCLFIGFFSWEFWTFAFYTTANLRKDHFTYTGMTSMLLKYIPGWFSGMVVLLYVITNLGCIVARSRDPDHPTSQCRWYQTVIRGEMGGVRCLQLIDLVRSYRYACPGPVEEFDAKKPP